MAEKRTTPETPQEAQQDTASGSRRKKRAAPTIDLTATEVPPTHEAPAPPQADPPPPPDPSQAAQESPSGGGSRTGGHVSVGIYVAGAAGAVVMTVILVALWLTGLVPVRYVTINGAQTSADMKINDTLAQRVSKIEQTIAKLPAEDAGVAGRLTAVDNALKALGIALTALNRRSDDIAANAGQARERADAAVKAVAELRDATKNNATGISLADLDALQKRVTALEQSAKAARDEIVRTATADTTARLALSAAGLRDTVLSGAPFAAELAQVKSLGADDKVLAPLSPFAAAGIPTAQTLAQELRTQLPAMLKISGAQTPAGGFLDRLAANVGRLVRIRPVGAPAGDDASAVLARIEIDVAKADIPAALADLGKLDDATRAPAQAWIAKADARQAALAAARRYAADATQALASPSGPKVAPKAGAR
jgi:hypothetical protein